MNVVASATARVQFRARAESVRRTDVIAAVSVWLGLVGGVVSLAYAYSYAARHSNADAMQFHLFWVGELLFFVPALVVLLQRSTARGTRIAVVIATALFDYVPKYLRDPTFPLYHDELIHSREVARIVATGSPFQPSPIIGVVKVFPGLHTAAASIEKLTGASQFGVQLSILVALHVVALLGVFVVAETMTGSPRAAGIAAFTYSINPSFLLFDAQFAYESLAIVFFVWTVAALVKAEAAANRRERIGWLLLATLFGCGCVVTHHLTTYALALTLLIIAVAAVRRARKGTAGWDGAMGYAAVAFAVLTAAIAWAAFVATGVGAYLAPHLEAGVRQLIGLLSRQQQSRTLFTRSTAPAYERDAAFLAPVIMFVTTVCATWLVRKRPLRSSAVAGLLVLAYVYFASLPFIYTQGGSEGARRSWGYAYLGVSVFVAFAVERLLSRPAAAAKLGAVIAALVGAAALVYVGNTAASLDQHYRFPGPPNVQSEIRALTPEVRSAASWLEATQGPDQRTVTDQYSGPPFAFFGKAFPPTPSAGFRTWELYLSSKLPPIRLAYELRASKYRYLFANAKIPLAARFYRPNVTGVPPRYGRTTMAVISRWDTLPWAFKVYGSDHAAVYRIDFPALFDAIRAARAREARP